MYKEIDSNKRKTWVIMSVFGLIIAALSAAIAVWLGDINFSYYVFGFASIYILIQLFFASKLALMTAGAKPIELRDNPRFYRIVENLSITTGLPMPKVYVINDSALNAFATGRNPDHAAVAATAGLIEALNDRELQAVMAHEMAHVGNYDIRVSLLAFALVATISFLSNILMRISYYGGDRRNKDSSIVFMIAAIVAAILGPTIALMVQMAVSRNREYLADATAALTTRDPESLASALQKISGSTALLKNQNTAMANMYINNPLKKRKFMAQVFSTHPPIEDRIKRLTDMKTQF